MGATSGHPTAQPYSRAGLLAKLTGAAVLAAGSFLVGQGTSQLASTGAGLTYSAGVLSCPGGYTAAGNIATTGNGKVIRAFDATNLRAVDLVADSGGRFAWGACANIGAAMVEQWTLYPAGTSNLYMRDQANARMHVLWAAGTATTAQTSIYSTVLMQGGTMFAPSTTQVVAAAGKIYAGDTSATSIQTAGGITAAGSLAASGLLHRLGLISTTGSASVYVDGGNSGSAGGASFLFTNNGTTIAGFGNYSAIYGGAYDARGALYSVNTLVIGPGAVSVTNTSASSIQTAGGITAAGQIVTNYNANPSGNAAINAIGTATLAASITDGFLSAFSFTPTYNGAFTVTRHNYINMPNVAGAATVTDACVIRFDAAAGTHKALAAGSTKATPGSVQAWIKVNRAGTIGYVPVYDSMTA